MKALKCTTPGNVEIQNVSVPQVKDDYILVKVKYCALNPTDWYTRPNGPSPQLQHD